MTVKDAVEATALFAKESKIATFIQTTYSTIVGVSTGAMKAFRIALVIMRDRCAGYRSYFIDH
jgi:surfactin synthase thioesterase subunit